MQPLAQHEKRPIDARWAFSLRGNDDAVMAGRTVVGMPAADLERMRWQKPKRSVIVLVPTVLRSDRYRVMIFGPPREHGPPHVHIYKGGEGTVVVLLGREHQLPAVRDVVDVGPRDVARALRILRAHADYLRERWRQIHGE